MIAYLFRRAGDALMRALCGEDVLDRVIREHRQDQS